MRYAVHASEIANILVTSAVLHFELVVIVVNKMRFFKNATFRNAPNIVGKTKCCVSFCNMFFFNFGKKRIILSEAPLTIIVTLSAVPFDDLRQTIANVNAPIQTSARIALNCMRLFPFSKWQADCYLFYLLIHRC